MLCNVLLSEVRLQHTANEWTANSPLNSYAEFLESEMGSVERNVASSSPSRQSSSAHRRFCDGRMKMDEVTKGVVPFMVAEFAILFSWCCSRNSSRYLPSGSWLRRAQLRDPAV